VAEERDPSARAGFLGRGWAFPPRFEPAKGAADMVSREADIVDSLRALFVTRPGERVMHPTYGCMLHDLVFEPMDGETEAAIELAIVRAIRFHEPRIEDVRVAVDIVDSHGRGRGPGAMADAREGRLAVAVDFRISATNNRLNVVFPFYLSEGTLVSLAPQALPG
jgi:phage baseplate assembly protein W